MAEGQQWDDALDLALWGESVQYHVAGYLSPDASDALQFLSDAWGMDPRGPLLEVLNLACVEAAAAVAARTRFTLTSGDVR